MIKKIFYIKIDFDDQEFEIYLINIKIIIRIKLLTCHKKNNFLATKQFGRYNIFREDIWKIFYDKRRNFLVGIRLIYSNFAARGFIFLLQKAKDFFLVAI